MLALKRLSLAGILILILSGEVMAQATGVRWQSDLEAAKRLAAETNRLVLVHFWAPWCKPCMNLERNVLNQASVGRAVETDFVPVKLNADLYPASAHRYGVTSLPTDVVLTPDGRLLSKTNSPANAQAYIGQLTRIAASQRPGGRTTLAQGGPATSRGGTFQPGGSFTQPVGISHPPANHPHQHDSVAQTTGPAVPFQGNFDRYAQAKPQANPMIGPPQLPQRYPMMAANRETNPNGAPQTTSNPPVVQASPPSPSSSESYRGNAAVNSVANRPPVGNQYANLPQNSVSSYARQPGPSSQVPWSQQPPASGSRYGVPIAQPTSPPAGSFRPNPTRPPVSPMLGAVAPRNQIPPQANVAAQRPPAGAGLGVPKVPPGNPAVGLDGYCTVTLKTGHRWVRGDARWGVIHLGRTYLFIGPNEQQQFLTNPDFYSPVLSGNDAVLALEKGLSVVGHRKHGVFYGEHVYLFSSEETLGRFRLNPQRYAEGVRQAVQSHSGQTPLR